MRDVSIFNAESLRTMLISCQCQLPDGRWVTARPEGFGSVTYRLKAVWMVLTGKADVLVWPGQ